MKLRGAWGIAMKFVSVATLFCCVVLWIVIVGVGKRDITSNSGSRNAENHWAAKQALTKEDFGKAYGRLPMSFEENQGQTAREVRYVAHGGGYELFLTPQEAVIALRPSQDLNFSPPHRSALIRALRQQRRAMQQTTAIRMRLEGANPEPLISGAERLPTRVNYFTGSDPKNWHTDIPAYARVKYAGIYPGVDLVFYGNQRRLEYDFVIAPGADPKAIQLKIDGARKLRINARGDLVLSVAEGEVEFQRPLIYQQVKGEKREIAGNYVVAGDHRVAFAVANYDRSEPLILDPVLNYSTYLGGGGDEGPAFPMGIAVDTAGDAIVVGQTFSTDFPTTSNGLTQQPLVGNLGASFMAELNPAGTQILYSTYLVGTTTSAADGATSVAVDSTGKVYVTGVTFAAGFPSKNPLPSPPNSADTTNGTCFVTKLDPTQSGNNSLVFSTYLGGGGAVGAGGEIGNGIAVDANGNAYVAGQTSSTDFPVMNAYQSTFNPLNLGNAFGSAFLSKINTTNSTLVYSTYLSGNAANAGGIATNGDQAFGVTVDTSNNAYVVGTTTSNNSTNFPSSTNANQMAPPAGNTQGSAFVSKINTAGSGAASLVYSTYIAGSTKELGYAIALGPNNVAYVTGPTSSNDFPTTAGAFDTSDAGGGGKAFVSVVDTTKTGVGNSLTYSTFLGGGGGDTAYGIRADAAGNAYIVGTTPSTNFPGTNTGTRLGGFQTILANPRGNAFIAKLSLGGKGTADLLYSTYFGGSGDGPPSTVPDQGFAIAIDSANPPNAYIAGWTPSANLPILTPLPGESTLKGPSDAFVAKFPLVPTLGIVPAPGTTLDFGTVQIGTTSPAQTVTLTNNTTGPISFTGAVKSGANAADYTVTTAGCTGGIVVGTPCVVSVTFTPTAPPATEVATLTITDGDSTSPQVFQLTGKGMNVPPDFGLTGPTAVQNVKVGATLMFNVTVTGVGGFNSPVALACTGAPLQAVCTVTSPVTPPVAPPSSIQAQVSMTTKAFVVPPPSGRTPPLSPRQVVPLVLALLLLLSLRWALRPRLRLAMGATLLLLVAFAGCSSSVHTPKGPATLTITGTSGSLNHSVQVQIAVN